MHIIMETRQYIPTSQVNSRLGHGRPRECIFPIVNKEKYLLFLLRSTTKITKWKNSNVYEYWQQQAHFRSNGQFGATLLHSFYTVLPIFYFTMLPIAQFSATKVSLNNNEKVGEVGGGGWVGEGAGGGRGWIVIYNPTKNPIKRKENRCSPNA